MKAKKYEKILSDVLSNHLEVSGSMESDIMLAFKAQVIIEKHKIERPKIVGCKLHEPIGEAVYFTDEVIEQIKEVLGEKLKGIHYT